jgi:alcohol dehydrogenase
MKAICSSSYTAVAHWSWEDPDTPALMSLSNLESDLVPLAPFDAVPRTRLVFGRQSVERVGELAQSLLAQHVLLVTDPGIVSAGHADRVRRSLAQAGVQVTCFDRVEENPSTECVDRCVDVARTAAIDAIVGLGGGSSMDTAKGCNFILTNGGVMRDYWGVGKARKPMLPLIAIPTTAGTGSECQSFALITDPQTHTKMACGDPKASARVAILDPDLTVSQPPRVTACTGVDAIAHAVETAVTRKRNPLSQMYSREAFRLTVAALPKVLSEPTDIEARGRMLWGAALSGLAIEHSMLGAAHAAANPLTARFGIVHGHAVGLMLPAVVRFNARDPQARQAYHELALAANLMKTNESTARSAQVLADCLKTLIRAAQLPSSLSALGINSHVLPELAQQATQQWTAQFNPVALTTDDFIELYQSVSR